MLSPTTPFAQSSGLGAFQGVEDAKAHVSPPAVSPGSQPSSPVFFDPPAHASSEPLPSAQHVELVARRSSSLKPKVVQLSETSTAAAGAAEPAAAAAADGAAQAQAAAVAGVVDGQGGDMQRPASKDVSLSISRAAMGNGGLFGLQRVDTQNSRLVYAPLNLREKPLEDWEDVWEDGSSEGEGDDEEEGAEEGREGEREQWGEAEINAGSRVANQGQQQQQQQQQTMHQQQQQVGGIEGNEQRSHGGMEVERQIQQQQQKQVGDLQDVPLLGLDHKMSVDIQAAPAAVLPDTASVSQQCQQQDKQQRLSLSPDHEQEQAAATAAVSPTNRAPLPHRLGFSNRRRKKKHHAAPEVVAAQQAGVLEKILKQEAAWLPLPHLLLLTGLTGSVLLTTLLSKMVPCGSWGAWVIQVSLVPVIAGVWGYARRMVLAKQRVKRRAGMDGQGDVHWTARNTIVFPSVCTLAGIMAGMFGLGGAVVKTPLMLELGVHPQVSSE